jgi:hypothetical protein
LTAHDLEALHEFDDLVQLVLRVVAREAAEDLALKDREQ